MASLGNRFIEWLWWRNPKNVRWFWDHMPPPDVSAIDAQIAEMLKSRRVKK